MGYAHPTKTGNQRNCFIWQILFMSYRFSTWQFIFMHECLGYDSLLRILLIFTYIISGKSDNIKKVTVDCVSFLKYFSREFDIVSLGRIDQRGAHISMAPAGRPQFGIVGKADIAIMPGCFFKEKAFLKYDSVSGLFAQTTSMAALFCFPVSTAHEINDDRTRGSWSSIHILTSRMLPEVEEVLRSISKTIKPARELSGDRLHWIDHPQKPPGR